MITDKLKQTHFTGAFLQLIKVSVSLPVTFLAFAGYALHSDIGGFDIWLLCAGIFLLAGSASALNQIIELRYDAIMPRTRKRPLPSGKISTQQAWIIVVIMAFGGIIILAKFNFTAVLLGFITLFWYAGVYTFLKRKTGFAVMPGSLTGALPPLIGWVAAGGSVTEPLIIFISIFVFIWQIPHFWLLLLIYGKEYQQAGFPTLFEHFTERQIRIGTFLSIVISITYASVYIGIFGRNLFLLTSLPLAILLLILVIYNLFYKHEIRNLKTIFHAVNFFMLLFLLTLLIIAKKNL